MTDLYGVILFFFVLGVAIVTLIFIVCWPPDLDEGTIIDTRGEGTTVTQEVITIVVLPDGSEEYYIYNGGWVRWYPTESPQPQPQTQEGQR